MQCLQKCVFPLYIDVFWTGSNSPNLDRVIIYPWISILSPSTLYNVSLAPHSLVPHWACSEWVIDQQMTQQRTSKCTASRLMLKNSLPESLFHMHCLWAPSQTSPVTSRRDDKICQTLLLLHYRCSVFHRSSASSGESGWLGNIWGCGLEPAMRRWED